MFANSKMTETRSHPILIFSSLLFSSISFHAYYAQVYQYCLIFTMVTILSVFYHSLNILKTLDTTMAHLAFLCVCIDNSIPFNESNTTTSTFLFFILIFWFLQKPFPKYSTHLHFALHLSTIVGMHFHLLSFDKGSRSLLKTEISNKSIFKVLLSPKKHRW